MKTDFDYIIVGQGIAGTLLHFELTNAGKNVLVIDNFYKRNSSLVAAGMYNPIVFKRLNKSWMADELLGVLNNTYPKIEHLINAKCYSPKNIVRLFATMEQQNDWMTRALVEGYEQYLTSEQTDVLTKNNILNEHGFGIVKEAGWVNTSVFLNGYRDYLKQNKLLLEEEVSHKEVILRDDIVTYKGVSASKIIFCEGNKVSDNPYFNFLPFTGSKGELLTVRIKGLETVETINKGFFILPVGGDIFKVGSTYKWDDLTETPTQERKEELLAKLTSVISHSYEVIEHKAGIRPTTIDRRPIIGIHPEHSQLAVFNGMGTKGVMIAPYFAKHFANVLINGLELNKEVTLRRFL